MRLADASVVLTGATSGIGAATAAALAGRCRRLVIHGPQPEREVAALLPSGDVLYLQADYENLADVVRLATDVRAAVGHAVDPENQRRLIEATTAALAPVLGGPVLGGRTPVD